MTDVIKGTRPGDIARPNHRYAEGRVCANEACETRLSVYNRSKYCWAHEPLRFPVVRGDRKRRAAA